MSEATASSTPKAAPNAPFWDPTKDFVAKTPIPVTPGKASAIPVLAIFRPNVQGKTAVEIYFALIGKNGCLFNPETGLPSQCAIVRGTWWLTGTRDDTNSRNAFSAALHALSYIKPLQSLEPAVAQAWCDQLVKTWRPCTLILENDPRSEGRYVRIRHVNALAGLSPEYTKALTKTGVIAAAVERAKETAAKVAASTGGSAEQLEVADDIPF